MTKHKKEDHEKLACHICQAEIPNAAAHHAEGREYVLHFCSSGCLLDWKKKKKEEDSPPSR